jgi:serine/threonine protein kinase
MTLAAGTKLGPYEIITPLGAGGMGEVYLARDPRLGRDVAVKILPESFASDADRLRRFEQEARSVAALNHPNILSVHDIGSHGGIHYIVTELLEGETLRGKLGGNSLTPRRATEYALQITQGLSAAHDKGIVHRDLKPENLFITRDARVKILDFGLAKQQVSLASDETVQGNTANTSEGMILGTVSYMAPEQVRGKIVDHRADIFAFGAVLYEMLSGQRAFGRNSSVETMTAILNEDPPEFASKGDQQAPVALQRIVLRCLEKSSEQRFQSARDLGFALENLSASPSQRALTLADPPPNRRRTLILSFVLGVIGISAIAVAARSLFIRTAPPEYQQITFRNGSVPAARFGPDGKSIIYCAAWDHPPVKMYSSSLDGTDVRELQLPASELLAVSTKGELAISLRTETPSGKVNRLARVPLGGGAPRELLDQVIAADWTRDGSQLAIVRRKAGKYLLEFPIGNRLYETIGMISELRFSPQGDAIAFLDHPILGDSRGRVALVDLKGTTRILTQDWDGEAGLAWSPDGKEVWFTAGNSGAARALYAVSRARKQRLILRSPGELELQDVTSDGRVLLQRVAMRYEVGGGLIGAAPRVLSWLQWMLGMGISRDGKFAVIGDWGTREKTYNVYLTNLDGSSPPLLLGSGGGGGISPDNKWVASIIPTDTSKVLLLPTGVGETKTVAASNFRYTSAGWTSDGRSLVVLASESGHPLRFWRQAVDTDEPHPITPEGFNGVFLSVNHADYVSARDAQGSLKLFPVDGSQPKSIAGITDSDEVIGGASESDALYVTPDPSAFPLQVFKLNTSTGLRQPFVSIQPADSAGIIAVFDPIFSADERRYVYTQVRELSVLYVATGLK